MSILGLIAAEQAKNKVKKGYTPLPEGANWFETLDTSLSNVPNLIDSTTEGIMGLIADSKKREQAIESVTDLSWDSVDQALGAVKDILTDERKAKEFISQNPDVLAGGIWGAGKVGKFIAPKGAEMAEQHLRDIGGIKDMAPPRKIDPGKMPLDEFEKMKAQVRANWGVGKASTYEENLRRGSEASKEIRRLVDEYGQQLAKKSKLLPKDESKAAKKTDFKKLKQGLLDFD